MQAAVCSPFARAEVEKGTFITWSLAVSRSACSAAAEEAALGPCPWKPLISVDSV